MVKKKKEDALSLVVPGGFILGCNYWASHAGTAMWTDWRPDVVEHDLKLLAEGGVQVVRVFPLWSVFQPINLLRSATGNPVEYRHGEDILPDTEAGEAGMSVEALEKFAFLLDRAHGLGLKAIVGLITGWMSGRLFVPPALEGRNIITDPVVNMWQVRFIRCFVSRFSDHPAILGWDLGNECNCLAPVNSREEAWRWTALMAGAIRESDSNHPVVSGMHGLNVGGSGNHWIIQDQGELTDVLTTHPYQAFTPYCDQDPVNTIRSILHGTAETRLYADIGGKPCFVEETGSLGRMFGNEENVARFARTALFSLWAHDCHGFFWWCGFDQKHLRHAPYDWNATERELGLMYVDGSAKPVFKEMKAFRKFFKELPFPYLPPRITDAVCILSEQPDHWAVAFSSFILAKQAGLDITYCDGKRKIAKSPLYLLPSVNDNIMSKQRWEELLGFVRAGAVLYMSLDSGFLSDFSEVTGLEVLFRERRGEQGEITIEDADGAWKCPFSAPVRFEFRPLKAEVLGSESDGNPAFTRVKYGKGRIYFLSVPVEVNLAVKPAVFHSEGQPPFWKIYRRFAEHVKSAKAICVNHPQVGLTEHILGSRRRLAVLINYSPIDLNVPVSVATGWSVRKVYRGMKPASANWFISGNDALVCEIAES